MTLRWIVLLVAGSVAVGLGAQQAETTLKTPKETLSYAMGVDLANSLIRQSIDIDMATFSQGLKDVLSGGKPLLSEEQVRIAMSTLQEEVKARMIAKNKKDGEDYLAQNKGKEGVVTLPSGLQYKILKAGEGAKPGINDTVVCNYRGTFIDGTEFDSSYKRNQPATFPVKGVIPGWTEALQLMPIGSRWQLFVPSNLAYGPRGVGPIGPDTTLLFEVELLSIQAKP
jgi:FKBP-type peptidyl-prolyl cis-trans isomerase FklB